MRYYLERFAVWRTAAIAVAFIPLIIWGCAGSGDESRAGAPAPMDSVIVVFTRDEAPAPVYRHVPENSAEPRAALEWLVRGPTPEGAAAGLRSWFSEKTASALKSVEVDSLGHTIVDFHDLRPLIPNASSSFGSTMLLQELNGTVFQFPGIRSVEYRMEGSCDLFWEWLQYGCQVVARPE
jgi:hypothetical protein